MIKLEIEDVSELKNLPTINTIELEKYLKKQFPKQYQEAISKTQSEIEIEEILEYISKQTNTDDICEVFLDLGADMTIIYGYIIE